MITVHHLDNSRSLRIVWLLEALQQPYELVTHHRDPQTLLAPESLKRLHPLGKAPLIVDEGLTVAESGAIIDYLIERYDDGRLAPAPGTPEHRDYRYWLHYAEGSAMPPLVMHLVFSRLGIEPRIAPHLGDQDHRDLVREGIPRDAGAAGVPVVPGTTEPVESTEDALVIAAEIGYPVMLKASWGGGGRGMRVIPDEATLAKEVLAAKREAMAAFGKDEIYLEKLVQRARHVEVQILGDGENVVLIHALRPSILEFRQQYLDPKMVEHRREIGLGTAPHRRVDGGSRRRRDDHAHRAASRPAPGLFHRDRSDAGAELRAVRRRRGGPGTAWRAREGHGGARALPSRSRGI